MADELDLDFRQEIERAVGHPLFKMLVLTLLSGDRYEIADKAELSLGDRVVSVVRRDGRIGLFPFEAICNVDILIVD